MVSLDPGSHDRAFEITDSMGRRYHHSFQRNCNKNSTNTCSNLSRKSTWPSKSTGLSLTSTTTSLGMLAETRNSSGKDQFSDEMPFLVSSIDLIEGKLGILDLLDEESRLPSGSDTSLVGKLYSRFAGTTPQTQQPFFEKPRFSAKAFTVKHYAIGVSYDIEGFLEKNKDTVTEELLAVLSNSKSEFLKEVLAAMPGSGPTGDDGSGKVKTKTKSTLGSIFKASLIELMKTIRSTEVHYIRCEWNHRAPSL